MQTATDRALHDGAVAGELALEIEREFDAPRALVCEMWTKPEHMRAWAAPAGFSVTAGESDVRPGGKWWTVMRSEAGDELRLSGTYWEVAPPERVVFTHQWDGSRETLVTVTFEETGGRTRMLFRQTGFDTAANRDGHEAGWGQSFEALGNFVRQFVAKDLQRAPRGDPDPHVLEIERVFDAPRALVFRLWSAPEHIARWWGPRGYHLDACSMDFREGGAWRFCMMPESGRGHWIHGVYTEIRAPERLAFTYTNDADGHEMLVELDFLEERGKTRLKFRQAMFMSVAERDGHRGGWTQTFEIFDRYLAVYEAGRLGADGLGWRRGESAGVEPDLPATAAG